MENVMNDKLTRISEPTVTIPIGMDCRLPKSPDQWSYETIEKMTSRQSQAIEYNQILNARLGRVLLRKIPSVYGDKS